MTRDDWTREYERALVDLRPHLEGAPRLLAARSATAWARLGAKGMDPGAAALLEQKAEEAEATAPEPASAKKAKKR